MILRLFLVLAFLPLSVHAGEQFWLERLSQNATAHRAPPALQREMAGTEHKDVKDCQEQLGYTDERMANYFAAVRFRVADDSRPVFLVFPSGYCFAFFGAHSVEFWIVAQNRNGTFKKLLTARQDGVEILPSKRHGMHDLRSHYNNETRVYRFDGIIYAESVE